MAGVTPVVVVVVIVAPATVALAAVLVVPAVQDADPVVALESGRAGHRNNSGIAVMGSTVTVLAIVVPAVTVLAIVVPAVTVLVLAIVVLAVPMLAVLVLPAGPGRHATVGDLGREAHVPEVVQRETRDSRARALDARIEADRHSGGDLGDAREVDWP